MRQRIQFCKTSDGVRIAYARSGEGPPLVKTASWLTHLEHEWESPVWRHWLAELSSRNTLIRYDPRGMGLSDREVGDVSLDAWVKDLEAVVDAAGLERFPLLGICQGGVIAIAYAARHPERVSRLVLYGSYATGAYACPTDPKRLSELRTLEQLIEVGWGHDVPAFQRVFAGMLMPQADIDQIHAMVELERASASAETAVRFWRAFHSFDVKPEIGQVKAESLVMHVSDDAVVPFEDGRGVASALPGARLVTLEGRNHILLEHEPAWRTFMEELHAELQDESAAQTWRREQGGLAQLTQREFKVLDLVARGLSNDQIAEQLFISQRTVRNHITSIFAKLDVENRAQAIVLAREAGLGRRNPAPSGQA